MSSKQIPHLSADGILRAADGSVICRIGRKTGWLDWLGSERVATRGFSYTSSYGHTIYVNRDRRRRAPNRPRYFIAMKRRDGRLYRRSLGPARAGNKKLLSLAHLDRIAAELCGAQHTLMAPTPGDAPQPAGQQEMKIG